MRRGAVTLVLAMGIGTVLAAWEMPAQRTTPEAALAAPAPAQKKGAHWEYVPLPEDVARGPGSLQVALRPLSLG